MMHIIVRGSRDALDINIAGRQVRYIKHPMMTVQKRSDELDRSKPDNDTSADNRFANANAHMASRSFGREFLSAHK